jgi:hypothetical protein
VDHHGDPVGARLGHRRTACDVIWHTRRFRKSGASLCPLILSFYWGNLAAFVFSVLGGFEVPAMYYATGETVAIVDAFKALFRRPWRYLIAGILFVVAVLVGFTFCFLPGIVVLLVAPVYVGKIFTTELSILAAFGSSFQAVYCSENSFTFVAIEIVVGLVVIAVSVFSCGLGLLFAPSIASFYVQNAAYRQGVLT